MAKTANWTDFDGDQIVLKYSGSARPTFHRLSHCLIHPTASARLQMPASQPRRQNIPCPVTAMPASFSSLEPLETRIAPAVILTFTDNVDNDQVKIVSDQPLTATVQFIGNGSPLITLSGAGLDGANVTTQVTRSATGDGFVNIGRIIATGLDLGTVTVKGDLGEIDSGNSGNPLPALKALKVASIGAFGTATQGMGDLVSQINGDVGSITVASDVIGARLVVTGSIGAVKIGGDLRGTDAGFSGRISAFDIGSITIGGDLAAGPGDESGKIIATGNLGKLTIGGSIYGAFDATGDPAAGQIFVGKDAGPITIQRDVFGASSEQKALDLRGNANAITIGGSIYGSSGKYSGAIVVAGDAGAVKIGRHSVGGSGEYANHIAISGTVASFTVGGDIRGGSGSQLDGTAINQISLGRSTGAVHIGGDVIGGTGVGSANIFIDNGATSLFIGGSIIGGGAATGEPIFPALPGGSLSVGAVGRIYIGGSIIESPFQGGILKTDSVGTLVIKGSLVGSDNLLTGVAGGELVRIDGSADSISIGGGILGTAGDPAVSGKPALLVLGNVKTLDITGGVAGGSISNSGSVRILGQADLVKIGGTLHGGSGFATGGLFVGGRLGALAIRGSVETGTGSFTNGQVTAASFGTVKLGGDLVGGGSGTENAGTIRALAGGIGSVTVGGSLLAGSFGGTISALTTLGQVKIGGNVSGTFAGSGPSLSATRAVSIRIGGDAIANSASSELMLFGESAGAISIGGDLRGPTPESARLSFASAAGFSAPGFTKLTIKGSVSGALISSGLAGMTLTNEDATLGTIEVRGHWTASSIVAGATRGADMDYATGDDGPANFNTAALSRIAAITIKGQAIGTAAAGDSFGFVAQAIGKVKVGGVTYTPSASPIALGSIFDDVAVRLL